MRKKLFNKAFFDKNFPQLKSKHQGGYPDMGDGQFAQKLPLEDWIKFANYQRAHGNYHEGIATILTFLAVSGLFFPTYTVALGALYIVGRFVYGMGYRNLGTCACSAHVRCPCRTVALLFLSCLYSSGPGSRLALVCRSLPPLVLCLCATGAGGRLYGAIMFDLSLLGLLCSSLYGSFLFAGGVSGVQHLFKF